MRSCTDSLRYVRTRFVDDEGQATVEAAFALPILMLLVLMLIQPGIVLYDRIVMTGAASEGCRLLATSGSGSISQCEDYIRRRLSAVPQTEIFHKHASGCSWDIVFEGNESSSEVKVVISNKIKPLPLLDIGMNIFGMLTDSGELEVKVESSAKTQPDWVWESLGSVGPDEWVSL